METTGRQGMYVAGGRLIDGAEAARIDAENRRRIASGDPAEWRGCVFVYDAEILDDLKTGEAKR